MHRCSENVAAIATALAKAQTELSNPEKAMIGSIYDARTDSQQSFRYASLSSGLDIIRKVLGSQQIAVMQTTDIDRTCGTVNLTTLLVHKTLTVGLHLIETIEEAPGAWRRAPGARARWRGP